MALGKYLYSSGFIELEKNDNNKPLPKNKKYFLSENSSKEVNK
ncbi:hypothetical protein FLJC2902T_19670 [Flavobacterium limnosediminis JC2902]|uniref:Uncharacterized protein n=1 Tax=Flavobacterium limnosediminis JC2902 TaxID=1341181 RepID=V6SLG7_9FLAO|nr:hypothetical protein FLJC2902T_19670 [Flavobacterium limnosediminis JC2902]